jgi:hypothetical protein
MVMELFEELMRVHLQSMQAITAPNEPGLYIIFSGSKALYVGMTHSSLRTRLRSQVSGPLASWILPRKLSKCHYRCLSVPGQNNVRYWLEGLATGILCPRFIGRKH